MAIMAARPDTIAHTMAPAAARPEVHDPGTDAAAGMNNDDAERNLFFGEDGLQFSDLLDVLNPLQHIPVIGDIYRSATADDLSAGARLAGGTLYGGPLGFLGALANTVVEDATGQDIGGNVVALMSDTESSETMANNTAPAAAAAPVENAIPAAPNHGTMTARDMTAAALAEIAPAAGPPASYLQHQASLPAPPFPDLKPMTAPAMQLRVASSGLSPAELSPAAFQALLQGTSL